MIKKLHYQHVDRNNLANYLALNEIAAAEAIAGSHIYRCATGRDDALVITLPDGSALIVTHETQAAVDRRRHAG